MVTLTLRDDGQLMMAAANRAAAIELTGDIARPTAALMPPLVTRVHVIPPQGIYFGWLELSTDAGRWTFRIPYRAWQAPAVPRFLTELRRAGYPVEDEAELNALEVPQEWSEND